jgi:hypothetical protein
MSMFAKIMVVVNLILAVVFLAAAGTLHGATENYKNRLAQEVTARGVDAATATTNIQNRDKEIASLKEANAAIRERAVAAEGIQKDQAQSMANLSNENARLRGEIATQGTNISELTKSVSDLTSRTEALSNKLATSEAEKAQVASDNATLRENNEREKSRADNAERSVAAAESNNKSLTEQLDRTTTELTGYKKTYPALGNASMKAVNGVVAATSAKDDVHVLSVGSKDGVEVGYEFTVFRGSDYVATIVIDAVYPNYSSGRVKGGTKKSDVRAGDSVATRL